MKSNLSTNKRNYGIDLLRIIAMFFVVILHTIGHGGVLKTSDSIFSFALNWFLETFAMPAVTLFVLISGFVGFRSNKPFPKLKNIISLYATVLFYSVMSYIILTLAFQRDFSIIQFIKACLPVLANQYWFFSCYIALFFISPILNAFVDKAEKRMLTIVLLTLFLW
jgi:surface polysaccharide O-acyltransferase-like enzyme